MEEISENYQHIWTASGLKKAAKKTQSKNTASAALLPAGLKKSSFPEFIAPQLATLVNKPPEGNQWLHEIKFDGYRILAFKKDKVITLKSRNNNEWTESFDAIAQALQMVPAKNAVFDGEIVILDKQGKSDFQLLQNSLKANTHPPFIYYLFDLLYFDSYDLRALKLVERKSILKIA